jgi:hypothetical protein
LFYFITFILDDEHGLSFGIMMHAKYMHELCSLLMHIPTYYNVINCYNHVLWGFSIDGPYFGYNSVEHENHVLRIFKFQEPYQT